MDTDEPYQFNTLEMLAHELVRELKTLGHVSAAGFGGKAHTWVALNRKTMTHPGVEIHFSETTVRVDIVSTDSSGVSHGERMGVWDLCDPQSLDKMWTVLHELLGEAS